MFMNIKKILGVFFVLLFLVSSVYAQDYSLYAGKFYEPDERQEKIEFDFYNGTYNICENEKKFVPVLVVNNANRDDKYSLSAFGVSWASLNVKEFSLPKRQRGAVFLELSPSANTKGKYSVGVNAFSSNNVRKDLLLNVDVEKCYSLRLELQEEDKVCGGISKQYEGEIVNDGKQKSDVELNVKGPNWVEADKNAFSIAPKDKQKIELNADIPANAKGIFNVIVSSVIKNLPSIKSEKILSIEVVPKFDCYKADVITDARITNDYSNVYVPIRIRNSGIKQAEYEVSLEAQSWISIEPKKISVNSEQTGNLNLHINPSSEVAEGNYDVKINVKFEDIVYSKNIDVELSKNKFFKALKSFFVFYKYYIYVVLAILIVLFIFKRQISNKIKTSYKNYKTKRARLQALEKARKARQLKKELKHLEKAEFEVRRRKYSIKWILFLVVLIVVISILFFLVYKFNFPISKEFVKSYYQYFIAGILISAFIIFVIEFYKPLFKMLKNIKKK